MSFAPGSRRRSKNQARAVCVRVAVFAEQNIITRPAPRDDVDPLHAQGFRQLRRKPKLLVGHAAGSNDGNFMAGKLLN